MAAFDIDLGLIEELHRSAAIVSEDKEKGEWPAPFPLICFVCSRERRVGLRLRREHRYERATGLAVVELHMAVGGGEQGVILAHADVLAGMHLGAALADDDIARNDGLAAELLDAEALGLGVATVARGAASFFVCHETVSLNKIGRASCRERVCQYV